MATALAFPISALATVDPIRISPDASTETKFQEQQRAWSERVFFEPFRERAHGKPWAQAGQTFVKQALDDWPSDRYSSEAPRIAELGRKLLADGCDDPLVGYLTTRAQWNTTLEYYATREEFSKLLTTAEKLPGPKALARFIAADFLSASFAVKLGVSDVPQRLAKLTAEVWTDGSYLPSEDFIYVRHVIMEPWRVFDEFRQKIMPAIKSVGLPEWVIATLTGCAELDRAWASRGTGFANTVAPEGWKGFQEHLAKARKQLVKGWKLRPDQPFAASMMITVIKGGDEGNGETARLWFDRAIAAQCDFMPAFHDLSSAWMPRWGGDDEMLIEFALACAATERFDTNIPAYIFTALSYAEADFPDLRLYRRKDIAPAVLRVCRGFANEPSRTGQKRDWLAELALYSWWVDDAESAAKALQECGAEPLPRSSIVNLHDFGIDEASLRGDVAILNNEKIRATFREASTLRAQGKSEAAAKLFGEAKAQESGIAADRLRGLEGIAKAEAKLAAGEWAAIPTDPTLSGWIQRSGSWSANGAGFPTIKNADGPVRIVYGARVGSDFELRATMEMKGEPQARWAGAIVFGDEGERKGKQRWQMAAVRFDKGEKVGTGRGFFRHYVLALPAVKCPWKEKNEFTLRLNDGKLTWTVNGVKIHENAKVESPSADARVGFGSFRHFADVEISLLNLEVRRLPSTTEPGAAQKEPETDLDDPAVDRSLNLKN